MLEDTLTIVVNSVGTYRITFHEGWSLRFYFREARILGHGINRAIYDLNNLTKGRLRLNYVPTLQSRIQIGSASWSPLAHIQRSSHDAEALASKVPEEVQLSPKVRPTLRAKPKQIIEEIESI